MRPGIRQFANQIEIDALVDDAEIAETRMRDAVLGDMIRTDFGLIMIGGTMRGIDAAGKALYLVVILALGLIQAGAAGENHIRTRKQFALALHQ